MFKFSRTSLLAALCIVALLAAVSASAKPKKSKRVPANASETLEINDAGQVFENGDEVEVRAGNQAAPLMLVEVLGVMGMGGSLTMKMKPIEVRAKDRNGKVQKTKIDGPAQVVLFEEDFKLFDKDKNETDNPREAAYAILPYTKNMDAEKIQVVWNECAGSVTGQYHDGKKAYGCAKSRKLSDTYYAFLRDNLLSCATEGLKAVGVTAKATAFHIVHNGTMPDAKHSKRSLHGAGRAVDIQECTVTAEDGNKRRFDFLKTNPNRKLSQRCAPADSDNCKFFEAYRSCWHKIHKARGCPDRASGNPVGTIGWEDRKHINHHLHTSMPFCPNPNRMFETSFGDDDEDASFSPFRPKEKSEDVEI